jgi:hypothetical protein
MKWIEGKEKWAMISESKKREKTAKEFQQRSTTGILAERKDFSFDLRYVNS